MAKNIFTLSNESNNVDKISREQLLELLCLESGEFGSINELNKKLNTLSLEYNKFNWTEALFGPSVHIWRYLFDNTVVKRDNIHYLVDIFLSDFTKYFNLTLLSAFLGFGTITELIHQINKHINEEDCKKMANEGNIYRCLIIKNNKVNYGEPEYYLTLSELSLKLLDRLLEKECQQIQPRKIYNNEIKGLKRWSPSKMQKEFESGLMKLQSGIKRQDPTVQKKWEKTVSNLTTFVKRATDAIKSSVSNPD